MIWGMGFLAVGSVVLGVAPQLAVNYFLNPILMALGMGTGVHVTWLGLSADAGSFSSTGGLVLALVSLVVGGAIYLVAYAVRPASSGAAMAGAGLGVPTDGSMSVGWAGGGVFTGGEPLGEQGRLTAGDFSEIFQEHWHSFFRWSNVDQVYLAMWRGLRAVSRALGVVVSWMERRATLLLVVFAAAIFVLARWIVPGVAPTHIPAVMPLEQMPLMLICAVGLAALALFVAALAGPASRRFIPQLFPPLLFLIGGLTIIGLLIPQAQMRLGALELAALLTVVLVWQTARSRAAKFAYLAVVLLSAGSMIASDLLADRGALEAARAFLLTGVAVKLALVPLFFWLLALADEVPALVLGIIIAVVDMAAFGEFLLGAQTIPALLTPQPLFFYAATLTSLVAALLMLTQRSLKRLLVLSTVEDVGFLLLGAASASTLGQNGAIIAASTHALAKALLFICLAAPEADGALAVEPVALAVRYPVSAFGFLFGMLAMLGIPPTLGFIGRWRLYSAAYQVGFCPLTIFIVSSILALIAYTLALTRNWWGPPPDPPPQSVAREPFLIKAVIVVLVAILLIAGIWPHGLQILMGVRP
jgi:formate hydrogenlyase subunit 3/multisubunit Na+/H+ antiporter MnhD subunit